MEKLLDYLNIMILFLKLSPFVQVLPGFACCSSMYSRELPEAAYPSVSCHDLLLTSRLFCWSRLPQNENK